MCLKGSRRAAQYECVSTVCSVEVIDILIRQTLKEIPFTVIVVSSNPEINESISVTIRIHGDKHNCQPFKCNCNRIVIASHYQLQEACDYPDNFQNVQQRHSKKRNPPH